MTNLKKKIVGLLSILSLCIIVTLYTNVMVASAAETEEGLVYYISSVSIEGGESQDMAVITGYKGDSPDVVIPEEINGYQVSIVCGFEYNGTIKTVTVLGDNVYFDSRAFYECKNLEKVEFKQGIGYINRDTFYECRKLRTVKNLKGLKSIGENAFYGCSSLESIELPITLTSIGRRAFNGCSSLQSIDIPKNVDSIGENAFYNCGNLTKINVASGNKNYTSVNSVLYTKDMKTLLRCPQAKTGDYSIPVGVTTIEDNAFYGSSLTSLNVPEGVVEIGKSAFVNSKFEKIVMPKSIDSIEDYWSYTNCFEGAENLVLYCVKNTFIVKYAINEDVKVNTDAHIGNFTATIKQPSFAYTGDYIKPVVTVKGKVNGKTVTLKVNKDYKVSYTNYKKPGKATIIIKGIGDYVGELQLSFSIVPKPIKSFTFSGRTASSVTLKWAKNANADGYVIEQYKGGKWTTIKTITKNTTVKYKVTNLKPSVNYKFRIKAYNKAGSSKVYSTYSTKSVKTVPSTVKGFAYKARTAKTITLKWTKNTSADGYVIQQYKGGKWVTVKTITNKSTVNYKVTGLKKNTSYKFRIKAYKKDNSKKLYSVSYSNRTVKTLKK